MVLRCSSHFYMLLASHRLWNIQNHRKLLRKKKLKVCSRVVWVSVRNVTIRVLDLSSVFTMSIVAELEKQQEFHMRTTDNCQSKLLNNTNYARTSYELKTMNWNNEWTSRTRISAWFHSVRFNSIQFDSARFNVGTTIGLRLPIGARTYQ